MRFDNSYFEDEVRNGFYIPAMVKKAWAAELTVLSEFDRVCKKHHIEYFADWGTLLAAVRHEGFIPWDDDLDVSMKRADYERFLEVAEKELPEGYTVINYERHENFFELLARVTSRSQICFEEDYLDEFHGFPYMAGIDIFLLDYVSKDEEKEKKRCEDAKYVLAIADAIGTNKLKPQTLESSLLKIEKQWGITIDRNKSNHDKRVQLYHLIENIFGCFTEEESECLTQLMPWGLKGKEYRLPKAYYRSALRLPYENTTIPVPIGYDAMLKRRYGDYMKLERNTSGHDYPFFSFQKKQLEKVLDFDLPKYTYSQNLQERRTSKTASLKEIASECREALLVYDGRIRGGDNCFEEAQQLALDLGNLIEQVKGEGTETVRNLENYCEGLFMVYQAAMMPVNGEKEQLYCQLEEACNAVCESIEVEILRRKEIVFLPFKAQTWEAFDPIWREAAADQNCDVYVIPIPYYYKKYDNTLYDMQYHPQDYPKEVFITPYDAFDFGLHHPEVVYIQNPYDEWNPSTSVHPFFYSENLLKYTDKLVYIPYFLLEEFTKECEREYSNMQYYCTVPGVVNADEVILQSENMRSVYIEKLVEFAGEDTRPLWERKIKGTGSPIMDARERCRQGGAAVPQEWERCLYQSDRQRKKVILYGIGGSTLMEYGFRFLEKLRRVFAIFGEKKEEILPVFYPHPQIQEITLAGRPEIWEDYEKLIEKYRKEDWIFFATESEIEKLMQIADAYYGDGSRIALQMREEGKPVMLQDVRIL